MCGITAGADRRSAVCIPANWRPCFVRAGVRPISLSPKQSRIHRERVMRRGGETTNYIGNCGLSFPVWVSAHASLHGERLTYPFTVVCCCHPKF